MSEPTPQLDYEPAAMRRRAVPTWKAAAFWLAVGLLGYLVAMLALVIAIRFGPD